MMPFSECIQDDLLCNFFLNSSVWFVGPICVWVNYFLNAALVYKLQKQYIRYQRKRQSQTDQKQKLSLIQTLSQWLDMQWYCTTKWNESSSLNCWVRLNVNCVDSRYKIWPMKENQEIDPWSWCSSKIPLTVHCMMSDRETRNTLDLRLFEHLVNRQSVVARERGKIRSHCDDAGILKILK